MSDDQTITPTWRDKLWVHVVYPIRHEWPERIQRRIAHMAPRWLVYFIVIRAYSDAWVRTNKAPDELTFDEVVGPWDKPRQGRQ